MWENIRATILSYERERIEKVKGGRDDSVALSPMTFTPTLRQLSVSRGGFREREQRARYRCMYYYCRGANTWLFCIRDVTLHLIVASRHSVTPIPLTLSSPFTKTAFFRNLFSLSRDSILVSTVTACVILFDDIKVSVFETIVVYILMSVLVLAIFLRKILSYWITLWGA